MVLREARSNRAIDWTVVGFIDDDLHKQRTSVQGVPVLGTLEQVAPLLASGQVAQVVVSDRIGAARAARRAAAAVRRRRRAYPARLHPVPRHGPERPLSSGECRGRRPCRREPADGTLGRLCGPWRPAIGRPVELLERIADKQARIGVIGLGYVGLPLAVEFAQAGFRVDRLSTSTRTRSTPLNARRPLHRRRADRGRRRRRRGRHACAPRTDSGGAGRGRRRQHLRADAAAQDQGPRHVVHRRTRSSRSRRVPAAGPAGRSSSRRPIPGTTDEVLLPDARGRRPDGRARTSSWPSRPSASIPATRASTPATPPRWSAASTPPCTRVGARALRQRHRDRRAGHLDPGGRDGQAAREHLPRRQHRPGRTSWR